MKKRASRTNVAVEKGPYEELMAWLKRKEGKASSSFLKRSENVAKINSSKFLAEHKKSEKRS